jgi:methionyl aminopeptidase
MIIAKSAREVNKMRAAGRIVAAVLRRMEEMAVPGVPRRELDQEAERIIREHNAKPLFKGYRGYPATICASVNEEVVHGIPDSRRLCEGDILSVDVGVNLNNYAADAARTLPVGKVSAEALALIEVCRSALEKAIVAAKAGARLSAVSRAIQQHAESHGCSVVRTYTGHGIGRSLHEDPQIPNFVSPALRLNDPVLRKGMTLAIEPMVNAGGHAVKVLPDGWTVVTEDGSLSAHFEDTVAVTDDGADILTR